ncbi:MAG: ABC transporter permease [Prolixibacteraceae bacterium]|nr:ABC transporter permease [Prolixibacteraceae bacterium]MBT6004387.1 ABC transporter permease [Prolixibacteraceae bacterium]MBT6765743.1 ABC transporter permease [Prolixibacteraceae bacterium]MBT6998510.1 ABC transporter permease [Prolixibacteraceae bacterium]MBT7397151.1 ABC transporter permease [Prolixibacteraceae bacterium]
MTQLLSFIKKEFYHISRDPRTMLILFGIPIAQLLIFGTVIKSEINDIHIAIYDQSKDETTQQITNKLLSSGYFILDENLKSLDEIDAIFKRGKVREVIVFENDFGKKLIIEGTAEMQLIVDASDPNTARLATSYTKGIVNDYIQKLYPNVKMPMQIKPEVRMYYNEEMKSAYMFVPGTMALILMLISTMMTSIAITREKELGTMEILLVSPLKPVHIIVGKVIPYFLLSIVNAFVIIIIGKVVFGVPITGSFILLMLETILFILMALCLGILISTAAKNQMVAMFISMIGLLLPTIMISGFMFPIENMPEVLQWFSHIMPARWYITIIRGIMLKGIGITFIWKETLILLGMTLFFIALSVKKFKIRLE